MHTQHIEWKNEHVTEYAQIWVNHANFMLTVLLDPQQDKAWYNEMVRRNLIYDC